jgi:Leucine-rich repeat (LRR) protein
LPPNLKELNVTGNMIDQIEPMRQPITSLIHLGIAYNKIRSPSLIGIVKNFPNLFSLDLAFNELCNFKDSMAQLEKLLSIKMLSLAGNPLQLTFKYREIVKQRLQDLRIFDGTQAFNEWEENAKKKFRKRVTAKLSHLGDIPREAYKVPEEDLIPIEANIKLEIGFRLFDNVAGIYINDENCRQLDTLNLDDVPTELKSSMFWLSYMNHKGQEVVTEKRAWIEHFSVDTEKGTGKCDLNHMITIEEPPSIEMRDWLQGDMLITLHTSQPKVIDKTLEEGEIVKDI